MTRTPFKSWFAQLMKRFMAKIVSILHSTNSIVVSLRKKTLKWMQMIQRDGKKGNSGEIKLPETLLLASIPVLTYLLSFAYEAGFIKKLGISPNLISLGFIDVLKNSISLILSIFTSSLLVIIYQHTIGGKKEGEPKNKKFFILSFIMLALLVYISYRYGWLVNKNFLLLTIFILFVVDFIVLWKLKIHDVWNEVKDTRFVVIPSVLAVMIAMSYFQGQCFSNRAKQYLVIEHKGSNSNCVSDTTVAILRIYNDLLICADVHGKEILNYKYKRLCDSGVVMVPEDNIGPLRKKGTDKATLHSFNEDISYLSHLLISHLLARWKKNG